MTHPVFDHVTYHAVYDASILDALEYARDNRFAGVQIAVETPHLSFESMSDDQLGQIASFVESNGSFISIHAPDEAVSLFQHSRILRDGIRGYYHALFDFAARIKARLVTIHLGEMPTFATDTRRELIIPQEDLSIYHGVAAQNLDMVLELAAGRFTVCIENYNMDEFSMFLLKPYLDDRRLALCWDLAKSWNKPTLERFFFTSLDRVKQVHLHDVRQDERGNVKSHRLIGTGEIDFLYYLNRLSEVEVLDYCIEVRPREKAKESLESLKNLMGVE